METHKRSASLDILRAVAILLVLVSHFAPYTGARFPFLSKIITFLRFGWSGVDLFFVLSGFLISGLLFKEHQKFGSISFKRFFIRRGFKIYPPFYALVLITLLYQAFENIPLWRSRLFAEVFFLQDYMRGLYNHTWSLAVEEQFYFLLPGLLVFAGWFRKEKKNVFDCIPAIFIAAAIFCLSARIFTTLTAPYHYRTHHFPLHLRFDSLMCGVFISYLYHYNTERLMTAVKRFKPMMFAAGIALFIPAIFERAEHPFVPTFGFTFVYLGSALVLLSCIDSDFGENWLTALLSFIGRHSYSIYLWHLPVLQQGAKPLFPPSDSWGMCALVYLAGSLIIGVMMSKAVEFPMLKLRDRFFPSRSSS